NANKIKSLLVLEGHSEAVQSVAFSPSGAQFASAGMDNTVRIWDTMTGKELHTLKGLTDRLSIAFSPNGSRLVAASSDQTIRVWDLNTYNELSPLRGHKDAVLGVAFNPNGTLLASASAD